MRIAITIIACLFIFACCKKDKDQIILHDIKGMVYNNCTDSGLANVTVYLKDGKGLNLSTVSDAVGNFIFRGVDIHSSSQYNYNIYIPSKSGIGASTFEYCGFVGTTLSFNYDEADMFFKPRVTPKFLQLSVIYQGSCNVNDTINPLFTQEIYHKNVSSSPFQFYMGTNGSLPNATLYNYNYPMGKYKIKITRFNSVTSEYTTSYDSIYLEWGANKTYTINW